MTTLICAGGTGTRILEAVLHLCAAGLGPNELRILLIDPDASNGNGDRAKKLLSQYIECQNALGREMGPVSYFHTKIDLLETEDGETGLKTWNPAGAKRQFKDILNYEALSREKQDTVHLFFTDAELEMNMDIGFRGHPSIGAATMSLMSLYKDQKPWKQLADKIRGELTESKEGSRIVIAGSVFGGTGASAIHPLAQFLRTIPEANHDRLKIGVVAMVPYFHFRPSSAAANTPGDGLAAKSEWFALASRSAAQYYGYLRDNGDWDFDSMYWLGDDSSIEVDYNIGGQRQENPAHLVDLLGAIACLDFFKGAPSLKSCYYAGPRQCNETGLSGLNVLEWADLPLTYIDRTTFCTRLLEFYAAGAMHLGFLEALMADPRADLEPFCIPWYLDRFATAGNYLSAPENRNVIAQISKFFEGFHYVWWRQILDLDHERCRLFNRMALNEPSADGVRVDMNRLGNLIFPERGEHTMDDVDEFFTSMVDVARNAVGKTAPATYLSMLGQASERFVARKYKGKEN